MAADEETWEVVEETPWVSAWDTQQADQVDF
jgi:hypothetical protein